MDQADRPGADSLTWRELAPDAASDTDTDVEMLGRGLRRGRTLVALCRPLPLEPAIRADIAGIDTRPFDPGADTDALIEVNNAAFDWHPDQGGWDRARLAEALSQRWVDPEGILVHEDAEGRLDGFCWTRIHAQGDPESAAPGEPLGEIWVIGAHPRTHGSGLGTALVAAGLDHLVSRGITEAMLWTEEDNDAALRMYDRLGFATHRRRGGYS